MAVSSWQRVVARNDCRNRLRFEPLEDRRMLSVLFVDGDAASGGDGLAWTTAYNDLQDALAEAVDGDQIWIAEGVYKPSAELEPGDARSASFSLVDGVALYGGFSGTETTPEERAASAHTTTLSGDLGTVDDSSDNAYTVLYCEGGIQAAVDGVSITGGNADGSRDSDHPERNRGGGIYSSGGLVVTNSTILGNSAGEGGGIYGFRATVTLANCVLLANSATIEGGGIYSTGTLAVTDSTLSGNSAGEGGGIRSLGEMTLSNSILWQNKGQDVVSGRERMSAAHNLVGIDPKFVRDPSDGGDGWGDDSGTSDVDESANDDYGDLRLTSQSPALDYGDDTLAVDAEGNPLTIDLDGNPRMYAGSPVDAGAFEFQGEIAAGREAASVTVAASGDTFDLYDGQISLREAVYYAETGSLGSTITFDGPLDRATIVLSGEAIWIDKAVTIDASSLTSLTVDADHRSRVFTVTAREEAAVELDHLTIIRGLSSRYGGGVFNSGNLTLTDSTVFENSVTGDWGDGGGIFNSGTLTLTNSTLSGNSASSGGGIRSVGVLVATNSTLSENSAKYSGGGICNSGALTLMDSTLSGNSVYNASEWNGSGGGIYNHSHGELTVINSTISGNTARDEGGGIFSDCTGVVEVISSTLSKNSAGEGGGIYSYQGQETLANCILRLNSATSGGGIYKYSGDMTLTNSTLSGNSAHADGSGIYVGYNGKLRLHNSILWQNGDEDTCSRGSMWATRTLIGIDPKFAREPSDGGDGWGDNPSTSDVDESANDDYGDFHLTTESPAINYGDNALAVDADGNPLATDLDGNPRMYAGSPVDAGVFEFQDEPTGRETVSVEVTTSEDVFDLYDGRISLREAIYYAGAALLGSTITFDGALDGATITLSGEAICVDKGITLDASSLTSLTVDANHQSRVFTVAANKEDPVELRHLTITGGSGERYGGGIYNSATLTLTECTVSGNSANDDGGGIYNRYATLNLMNSTLSGNSAGGGGGMFNLYSTVALTNSTLSGNSAFCGGGVYNRDSTLTLMDSTISGNVAVDGYGGGINANSGTVTVTNSTLSKNAADEDGGGIYVRYAVLTVMNSTFLGNSARLGGGVYNYDGTSTLTNSTLAGNSASSGGGICNGEGTLTVTNSTIAGNAALGTGGISFSEKYSTATLDNTIVAGNYSISGRPDFSVSAKNFTGLNNLIGDGSNQTILIHGQDGNLVGTEEAPIDPRFIRNPSDGGDGWGDDPDTPNVDESANDDYGDLRLRADSPAIDAGDDTLLPTDALDLDADGDTAEPIPVDMAGSTRIEDGDGDGTAIVDMGAYEYFAPAFVPGDLNSDEMVNADDLDIVRAHWGQTVTPGSLPDGDPSGDGLVNTADLDIVRANWGQTAPAAAVVPAAVDERPAETATAASEVVYGPRRQSVSNQRTPSDALFANTRALAEVAWSDAVEALAAHREQKLRAGAAVDLALAGWE